MANPGPSHIAVAKRILRYAKGTSTVGITYTVGSAAANQLYAYVDADHAGDPEGRRSVTGYCVMMNGESEFYAASACGCEIMYLRTVMSAMGFEQTGPTPVAARGQRRVYLHVEVLGDVPQRKAHRCACIQASG
eukprot:3798581-Rhodomonas_salina.1